MMNAGAGTVGIVRPVHIAPRYSGQAELDDVGLDRQQPVFYKSTTPADEALLQDSRIPPRYRSLFPFPRFNRMQEYVLAPALRATLASLAWLTRIRKLALVVHRAVLDALLGSQRPIVVSAPTGSGKTAVLNMAIVAMLMRPHHETAKARSKPIHRCCHHSQWCADRVLVTNQGVVQ